MALVLILTPMDFAHAGKSGKVNRARAAIGAAGGLIGKDGIGGPGFGSAHVYIVDFSRTDLTDDQLIALVPSLRDLGGIRFLYLRHTKIGDRGLLSLAKLDKLYVVDVTGTHVTK